MKKISDGRRPQKIKSGISQQLLYGLSLMSSEGGNKGKPIGNLECCSAQPSLFASSISPVLTVFTDENTTQISDWITLFEVVRSLKKAVCQKEI